MIISALYMTSPKSSAVMPVKEYIVGFITFGGSFFIGYWLESANFLQARRHFQGLYQVVRKYNINSFLPHPRTKNVATKVKTTSNGRLI